MNGLETDMFGGFNIGERIIDEQTLLRRSVDALQCEMKDRWIWFDEIVLAGDDHLVEDLKKAMLPADKFEFFDGEITEQIESPTGVFELACNSNGLVIGAGDAFLPMGVVCLDESRVLRVTAGEFANAFAEGETGVLAGVPLCKVNLFQKTVDRPEVRKEALVQVAGIPVDQDVPKVEDDGGDGRVHTGGYFIPIPMMRICAV